METSKNDFVIEWSSTVMKVYIKNTMTLVKLVVTENYEIEYR